jgi:hypothetical protein
VSDTITLAISGRISLDELADAVSDFRGLIAALTRQVARTEPIEWRVVSVVPNGAILVNQGIGSPAAVENVVREFEAVAPSIAQHDSDALPYRLRSHAERLIADVQGNVESIRLETEARDATIYPFPTSAGEEAPTAARGADGLARGRIQTVSSRRTLHFILYDEVDDRPVSCYLARTSSDAEAQERLRAMWGQLATVAGTIRRDPRTGRPTTIRGIDPVRGIELIKEPRLRRFLRAEGAFPWVDEDEPAEDVVRRLRDA